MKTIFTILLSALLIIPAYADGTHPRGITLDGTIGTAGKLAIQGPKYDIRAEYGHQAGPNLFHSFQQFNIHADESATFSGPRSVQNIISRVTGGESSWIDGTLRSAIEGADLYLLNRAGVMFGPNASLGLTGSFHVSTADYLRLGESDQFYTQPLESDILSTAAPAAFGFLDSDIAGITVEGKGDIPREEWDGNPAGLTVPDGETISLIAGDIEIRKGTHFTTTKTIPNPAPDGPPFVEVTQTTPLGSLSAPAGRINLISIASEGEVTTDHGPTDHGPTTTDQITLSDKSLIDVSGTGGGSVFIRGGQFVARDSMIRADTLGDKDGIGVDIRADDISFHDGAGIGAITHGTGRGCDVTLSAGESVVLAGENKEGDLSGIKIQALVKEEGAGHAGDVFTEAKNISKEEGARHAGDVFIEAKNISLENGGFVENSTGGRGNGGNITVDAKERLSLTGESGTGWMSTVLAMSDPTSNGGNGGDILIEAGEILLDDGALIITPTFGPGKGGNITINANGMVTVSGACAIGDASAIGSTSNSSFKEDGITGHGGDVFITAGELFLKNGGGISSSSEASKGRKSGEAGDVTIQVSGTTRITGVNLYGDNGMFESGIFSRSVGNGDTSGDAGKISLETGALIMEEGATISTSTTGNAQGGDISIEAHDTVIISGDSSHIQLNDPGPTQIAYREMTGQYEQRNAVSGIYADSKGTSAKSGNCGNIFVSARTITLADKGTVSTSTAGGGRGGTIILEVGSLCLDTAAVISSKSGSANFHPAEDISDRDARFVLTDDVAEIGVKEDAMLRYIFTGEAWLRINQTYTVSDIKGLDQLSEKHALSHGDRVEVSDAGDESGDYIYSYGEWLRLSDKNQTVANMSELQSFERLDIGSATELPFEFGEVVQVSDAGNGKPAEFYYSDHYGRGAFFERLTRFDVADMAELSEMTETYGFRPDDMVSVRNTGAGESADFFYKEDGWKEVKADNPHTGTALTDLTILNPGDIVGTVEAETGQGGRFILGTDGWLPLKNLHTVDTLAERDTFAAETGDVVKVNDMGDGTTSSFLFSDGEWMKTYTSGDAGTVTIIADKVIDMRNSATLSTETNGQGKAGAIDLTAPEIRLETASVSSGSKSEFDGGDAGTISVSAGNSVRISGNSALTTESNDAGGGGITVSAGDILHLNNSQITTSVNGGSGSGGDITIRDPKFMTLNRSEIKANAYEGTGGNISIVAEQFVQSSDSTVEASSEKGIDGTINIESPETDVNRDLMILPGTYLDPDRWMKTPCKARIGEDVSRFTIIGRDAAPAQLDDLQPSPLLLKSEE